MIHTLQKSPKSAIFSKIWKKKQLNQKTWPTTSSTLKNLSHIKSSGRSRRAKKRKASFGRRSPENLWSGVWDLATESGGGNVVTELYCSWILRRARRQSATEKAITSFHPSHTTPRRDNGSWGCGFLVIAITHRRKINIRLSPTDSVKRINNLFRVFEVKTETEELDLREKVEEKR